MVTTFGPLLCQLPTQQPTSDEVDIGNITFKTFDLGGHDVARRVWKDYFPSVSAIVFIVDAHDRTRFAEAKTVLGGLLSEEYIAEVPILILGNKIDLGRAPPEHDLAAALGVTQSVTGKSQAGAPAGVRPMEVYMCSMVRRSGYGDGFKWLASHIK